MRAAVLGVLALLAAQQAGAAVSERIMRVSGAQVSYKLVLPEGYDVERTYPAILVFGGGPQTMSTIEGTLERNFRGEAEKRGYIVIGAAAPDGDLFFYDGDRIFPEFLEKILAAYKIEGGKFHVAGPSNGGIAALHVAAKHPTYFYSATAFPGYLWQPTPAKLEALHGICTYFYVGEHDEYRWHDEMEREAEYLLAHGTISHYSVEKGQSHRIESLAGANASRLFDDFEAARLGCGGSR